jgi:hypothetical protein
MLGGYSAGVIRHEERGMRGINGNFGAIDAALAGFLVKMSSFRKITVHQTSYKQMVSR